jgi:hypothetical protein
LQWAGAPLNESSYEDFKSLLPHISETRLRLNLTYRDLLASCDAHLPFRSKTLVDIGSQDFAYAPALALWMARRGGLAVSGMELDPYVFYFDFYRRYDVARAYAQQAERYGGIKVRYEAGDWLEDAVECQADLVTYFFPFLFEDLHRRARLPRGSFNPQFAYAKAWKTAQQAVIFFHQGESEAEGSLKIIRELSGVEGPIVECQKFEPDTFWIKRRWPIFRIIWQKPLLQRREQ